MRLARTLALAALAALAPRPGVATTDSPYAIDYQKHVLGNGLEVILHEDHSDPLVAVYVYYHVGSGREEPGRSGFAHLFEHVMFQGSANVGDDQHFKLIQEAGGTLNGTTNADRTNYFETVPSNQLELALWLEADRMGFLLPAVTQEKLDNQREVVKNERRQNYENRPYAQAREVVARTLYPPDHPYSWITIGSMDDLSAASLEDVHAFFKRWYGPNNATLAIGGDIDPERTLSLVERYFGAIPRGPEVADPKPRPVALGATRREVMEDRVKLPELSYTWPAVELGHPDEPALDLLAAVLSANDSAILDKALRMDEQLASRVSAWSSSSELAGTFSVTLRPQPGISLDELEGRMLTLMADLGRNGVEPERLERLKNRYEAQVIRRVETVSGRTSRLANDNTFHDDPGHLARDIAAHLAVTTDDVERVLRRYVLGRPAVVVSVVPKGKLDMAATGAATPPAFLNAGLDRTVQPEPGPRPGFNPPLTWTAELGNGVSVIGTPFDEVPLTRFSLSVQAGRIHEDMDTLGMASMTAALLDQGTARLTAVELVDELDGIGATLRVSSDEDEISFSVSCLDRNLPKAVALLQEVLLEPRFAEEDFERVRKDRLTSLETRGDQIRAIAADAWDAVVYGRDTVRGNPSLGTVETVSRMTVDDVRRYWRRHGTPTGARLTWVGNRDARGVRQLFRSLASKWKAPAEALTAHAPPQFGSPEKLERTAIYLVDKPGAPQSEIRIGHPAVAATHEDYYPLSILNHALGGSFSSRINLNLREDKGYTYGARSRFSGDLHDGIFVASAGVRTNVTAASVTEFLKEIRGILTGPTEEELAFTKDALLQAMTRQFESTFARQRMIEWISKYGEPEDYLVRRRARLEAITREELAALAREHLDPSHLAILVVGDAQAVRADLEGLDLGPVTELAPDGAPVAAEAASASASGGD